MYHHRGHHHQQAASRSRFAKVYNTDLRRPVHVLLLKKDNRAGVQNYNNKNHHHHQQHQKKSALVEKSCSDYVQLRQVMASQKELLGKLERATSAEERTTLAESLKLAVFHAKDLQRELEEKHQLLVGEGGRLKETETKKEKSKASLHSLKRPASVVSFSSSSSESENSSSKAALKRCRFESNGSSSSKSSSVSSSNKSSN